MQNKIIMKLLTILCCLFFSVQIVAQQSAVKKQSTIGLHVFYNDFNTAQQIRTTSLKNVLDNKLWSKFSNMQVGLGVSYLKGLTNKIDFVGTIDGSYVDYLFKSGATNGSSKFLLTTQAAVNIKMFTDKKTVVPYLTTGAGFSMYNSKTGFYAPVGMGLQFNFFNDAFVFTDAQYRLALSPNVNYHFNYSVGIATGIGKQKKKTTPLPPAIIEPVKQPEPVVIKIPVKNILVKVTDEATSQPLPYVDITISGPEGKKFSGTTDANGTVIFNGIAAADYSVSGTLNNVNTSAQNLITGNFTTEENDLKINLTHNDPRFTLSGNVVNKNTNQPESGVDVTVTNETQSSINTQQSKEGDGSFKIQLEPNSDFTIVGKKASYLSNIEKASTKGLNRSTTLYLKLELDVQQVTAAKNIVLNNINFATGKAVVDTKNSADLDKLIQFLKDNPGLRLEIQGHTDNVGSVVNNIALSQKRANVIVAYLVQHGIEKERLIAKGYGPSKPIADNASPEGKAQNRRVEMKLIE
jgi:outer membrane protein OmpA-like peptidoglycan-associated protein